MVLQSAEAVATAGEIELDGTLFNILTQSLEGKALSVMMNAEVGNGLQAWKMLVDTYEPKAGGRFASIKKSHLQ